MHGAKVKIWSLTFKEEHRLWVFEIRLLRKTFRPKGHHLTEDWKHSKRIPSIFKDESTDHVYVLGHSYTCYTYCCYANHFYAYRLYFINVSICIVYCILPSFAF
jgi:hypothetical protein